jgi:two-component system NarL family sensor kinase
MKNSVLLTSILSLVFALSNCNQGERKILVDDIAIAIFDSSVTYQKTDTSSYLKAVSKLDSLASTSEFAKRLMLISKARYEQSISAHQTALATLNKALATNTEDKSSRFYGTILASMGASHRELGEYPAAEKALLSALTIFEKNGDQRAVGNVYGALSIMYQIKGDIANAKIYVQNGMKLSANEPWQPSYLFSAHTLANLYGMSNQLDSALMLDNACLQIIDSFGLTSFSSQFYDNKAICFMMLGKYDSARYFYNKCLAIDMAQGNKKLVADTYTHLGILKSSESKTITTQPEIEEGMAIMREIDYKQGLASTWLYLSDMYKESKDFKGALAAKDSFVFYRNQLVNERTEAKIAEFKTLFETEKKDNLLAIQNQKIINHRVIIFAISIILLGLIIFALNFYNNYKTKKEKELDDKLKHQQDLTTQAIFESEQQERVRIARDLHDSVGQMLSVVKMQLSNSLEISTPSLQTSLHQTAALVDRTIQETRVISHDLIPHELNFGLLSALEDLAYKTNQSNGTKIVLNLGDKTAFYKLDKPKEVALYRIIQEIVNNMLKHANASQIVISTDVKEQIHSLKIVDNGKGFDTLKIYESKGIGWKNIFARAKLIGADIMINSLIENGTTAIITIEK